MNDELAGKLLVISEKGIGDALTLIPCLQEIKRIYTKIEIDFLAPGIQPLAKNFQDFTNFINPSIQQKSLEEKLNWLKNQDYKWVWNTENKEKGWRLLLAQANKPGWTSAPPHRSWPKKQVVQLRLLQFRELLPGLQNAIDPEIHLTDDQEIEKCEFDQLLTNYSDTISIHPGGNDPNKIWDMRKYHRVIEKLTGRNSTVVVLFLTKDDLSNFDEKYLSNRPNLVRITEPLKSAVPKLAACKLFIGNDSGFYHLAHALGLSVVGIYRTWGSKKIWSYQSSRAKALGFFLPRLLRNHWRKFISVKKVLKAVDALLDVRN